jgi:hypothetical protein
MNSLHGEGMPEDKGNACTGAEVGEPVPGEETFHGHDEMLSIGCHGLEKRFWASWHVPVDKNLAILVQEAEVHGAGMQIDAAVKLMLFGVEAHEVSSSCE